MKNTALLSMVESMIQRLKEPVTKEEISDGWSDEVKGRVVEYFTSVREHIAKGEEVEHVGIVRSLDFDGVCRGDLICEIAQLMKAIRKYNEEL